MLQGLDVLWVVPLDTLQHRFDLRLHVIHVVVVAAAPPKPNPRVGAEAGAPPKEKLEPVAAAVVVGAAGVDPKLNPVEPPAAGAAPAPNEKFMTSVFKLFICF